jgi:glycine/D-amino acid oxidase-like deaminating enzyme
MKKYDLIIVGQGLAGSVLTMKLMKKGFSVKVIDRPELSACSKVAAGIWNPVVFKRLSKSWKVDEVLPEMLEFYKKCEEELQVKLITQRNIIKIFSEQQEVDLWTKKASGELENYLDKKIYTEELKGIKTSSFGYSKVLNSGNIHVAAFLNSVRDHLEKKGDFLNEEFDHKALQRGKEIKYKDIQANGIIFCEGHLIKNNPLFNFTPMKPAKGEVLTIRSEETNTSEDIINKNAFLLPLENNTYKAGATYNWEDLNDQTSEAGLMELNNKLSKIMSTDFKVLKQEAGVRPSVSDRRPVLGVHPEHKNVYLFNGMGTKGVMLAPYFAQRLLEFIVSGKALDPEVDLSRFIRFFVS